MARAGARIAALGEERFDDAVFQRMERHHHQPPAGLEHALGRRERGGQFAELVVHENAQRLERARRRMNIAGSRAHDRCDDIGKRTRGGDRRIGARLDDGAGDRARMPLLAERENDVGEIALARAR